MSTDTIKEAVVLKLARIEYSISQLAHYTGVVEHQQRHRYAHLSAASAS